MTVTTPRRRQSQLTPSVQRRQHRSKQIQAVPGSNVAPSLKASLVGGFGILILMLIGLIPPPENLPFVSLAFLVVPGFLVVCLATGLLAGIFAGETITNSHEGGKLGWMAGFWAGIFGGVVAMFLAAIGFLMENFGLNVASQFATDLESLGLSAGAIALTGRVVGALVVYGIIGSLVSGLLSSIGGMLYPKLTR